MSGAADAFNAQVLLAILAGVPVGLIGGLLPGVTGITTLALLIPFTFGMDPLPGLAFLLSAHAVIYTGGSVTAILFGIPGAPANAATVTDGHALARAGYAGRAIGAAVTASSLGGLFGFAVLIAMLPLVRAILTYVGSPEIFLMALLGLVFAAKIAGASPLKGLIAATLGLLLGAVGYQSSTAIPRFWFGVDTLLDGVGLVPLVTGLFAGPALLAMASRNSQLSGRPPKQIDFGQVIHGVLDVIKRPMLTIRAAMVGSGVGIVPGIGGDVAPFMAYAWLAGRQEGTSASEGEDTEQRIVGVIAPESSNNAKEGGALIPTLGFGVPGSAAMSVLLGSFAIFGLEPGPHFLIDHANIAIGLAFALALANTIGGALLLLLAVPLTRLIYLPMHILVPAILAFATLGVMSLRGSLVDLVVAGAFTVVGQCMVRYGYSRPAFILGFVLSPLIETYFQITMGTLGPAFVLRPISFVLCVLILWRLAGYLWWHLDRTERTP